MKRLLILGLIAAALVLSACTVTPEEGQPFTDQHIYIRDTVGRCLQLNPNVHVAGGQYGMSGSLGIRIIPSFLCQEAK